MRILRAADAQTFAPAGHAGVLNQIIAGREQSGVEGVSVWRGIFEDGGTADLHRHESSVQIYVVLSGAFVVGDGAQTVRLDVDDSVIIPAGQPHAIGAVDGPGTVLVISAPALR